MSDVKSDIQIAREAKMQPIKDILAKINVPDESSAFSPMGRHIAKINLEYLDSLKSKKEGKLILVTAISAILIPYYQNKLQSSDFFVAQGLLSGFVFIVFLVDSYSLCIIAGVVIIHTLSYVYHMSKSANLRFIVTALLIALFIINIKKIITI